MLFIFAAKIECYTLYNEYTDNCIFIGIGVHKQKTNTINSLAMIHH
jgi:hypothetical protein